MMIAIRPAQKVGIETPISENDVARRSKIEYCLVAETIPMSTPTMTEMATLYDASFSVVDCGVI